RAEAAAAGVDAEPRGDGAVDDEEGGHGVRRRLHAVEVERGLEHRLDRGAEHGERRGLAARHHRVDRELLERRLAPERRHRAERALGRGAAEHRSHARIRGRDDREAVAPAALAERRQYHLGIVLELEQALARHATRPMRLASCSTAWSARRATASGRSPPSGCWTTSSGRPEIPSAAISLTARPWNAVVPMRPAGVPILATSRASWRLHDVQ